MGPDEHGEGKSFQITGEVGDSYSSSTAWGSWWLYGEIGLTENQRLKIIPVVILGGPFRVGKATSLSGDLQLLTSMSGEVPRREPNAGLL